MKNAMLTDLCRELNNWFEIRDKYGRPNGRRFGTFTIKNGTLAIDGAQNGQYVRICESVSNDGVYEYPLSDLKDETFYGAVWLMAVPPEVVELSKKIEEWIEKYGDVVRSPFNSETFDDYSYTKASASATGANGVSSPTWQSAFADELSHWRKI